MAEPIDTNEKIAILDLSADILRYRLLKKEVSEADYRKLLLAILKNRSKLGKGPAPVEVPPTRSPENTHESSLIRLGGGAIDENGYMELGFRPSFNDLDDPDFPDDNGMQIQFLNTRLRYYVEDEKWEAERVEVIDINSMSSRDAAFKPPSWRVSTGWKRELTKDGERPILFYLNGGTGVSYFHSLTGLFYTMILAEIDISHHYEHDITGGAGIESGIVKRILEPYKIHIYGRMLGVLDDDINYRRTLALSQRLRLFRDIQLSLTTEFSKDYTHSYQDYTLTLLWYF